jgi:hypothetical protein
VIFCTECNVDIENVLKTCACSNILNWSVLSETIPPEFSLIFPRNQYFLNFQSGQIFYLDDDRAIVLNER